MRKTGYLPTLDGWRAVAIALVVLHHAIGKGAVGIGKVLHDRGVVGVDIFFGLSGFLITTRLLMEWEERGRISMRGFYVRRVFRILPAAVGFLAVAGVLGWMGVVKVPVGQWWAALLFYANYYKNPAWTLGHFWSLSIEEHFYLVFPAVLIAARRRALLVTLGMIGGLWLLRAWAAQRHFIYFPNYGDRTDLRSDGLLWGCAMALWLWEREGRNFKFQISKGMMTCAGGVPAEGGNLRFEISRKRIGGWVFGVVGGVFLGMMLVRTDAGWYWFVEPMVLGFVVPVMLVSTMLAEGSVAFRVLEWGVMRWVGRLSYSLYLWQELFCTWEPVRGMGGMQRFPVNIMLAVGCAAGSYYLVERPFVRWGHWVTGSPPRSGGLWRRGGSV